MIGEREPRFHDRATWDEKAGPGKGEILLVVCPRIFNRVLCDDSVLKSLFVMEKSRRPEHWDIPSARSNKRSGAKCGHGRCSALCSHLNQPLCARRQIQHGTFRKAGKHSFPQKMQFTSRASLQGLLSAPCFWYPVFQRHTPLREAT